MATTIGNERCAFTVYSTDFSSWWWSIDYHFVDGGPFPTKAAAFEAVCATILKWHGSQEASGASSPSHGRRAEVPARAA
jgi:hypothetical protein